MITNDGGHARRDHQCRSPRRWSSPYNGNVPAPTTSPHNPAAVTLTNPTRPTLPPRPPGTPRPRGPAVPSAAVPKRHEPTIFGRAPSGGCRKGGQLPSYAWVAADLPCPTCQGVLTNDVWFAWGGLLSRDYHSGPVYEVGDRLLWFSNAAGRAHADAMVPTLRGLNVGDPCLPDVDVYEINGVPGRCPHCRTKVFGSRVSIRAGVIRRVEAVPEGEYDKDLLAIVLDPATGSTLHRFDIFGRVTEMPLPGPREMAPLPAAGSLDGTCRTAPESAQVLTDVRCPGCEEKLTRLVRFAWGGLLSAHPGSGPMYTIGDWLLWFADDDGIVHGDARAPAGRGVNVGDPRIENVDIYDVGEGSGVPAGCPGCGLGLMGVRVSLRFGAIRWVEAVPAGQHDDQVQAVEVDPRTGNLSRSLPLDRPIAAAAGEP